MAEMIETESNAGQDIEDDISSIQVKYIFSLFINHVTYSQRQNEQFGLILADYNDEFWLNK